MIHILFLKKTINFNNKCLYKNIYLTNKISTKEKYLFINIYTYILLIIKVIINN